MRTRLFSIGSLVVFIVACKNETPPAPAAPTASTPIASPTASTSAPASSSRDRVATPEPGSASTSCTSDTDCVLSTFPGCCSCCECGALHAATRSMDVAQHDACKLKDCAACDKTRDYKCIACKDPAKEGMHARCRDSACILVETSAAAAEPTIPCKTDDDCWMDDARKPIARPAKLRGKKLQPCKGTEHVPACKEGVCLVRAFKC